MFLESFDLGLKRNKSQKRSGIEENLTEKKKKKREREWLT